MKKTNYFKLLALVLINFLLPSNKVFGQLTLPGKSQ